MKNHDPQYQSEEMCKATDQILPSTYTLSLKTFSSEQAAERVAN